MKWVASLIIFIFCLVGLEIYRNTELVRASYTSQKLKGIRNSLVKENGSLKEQLSSSVSLGSLERKARGSLGLECPHDVSFLR